MPDNRIRYVFDLTITIPARSLKEAEHFAILATQNAARRKAILYTDMRYVSSFAPWDGEEST